MVTAVNCYSVSLTVHLQSFLTFAKLAAIAAIVIGGCYQLAVGNMQFGLISAHHS